MAAALINQSFEVKNIDTGEKWEISEEAAQDFCDFDTFDNGGAKFTVQVRGNPNPRGSFTAYDVEVLERRGERKWYFAKRYSDFVSLHQMLTEAGYGVDKIKDALPPKKWFGNLEGDVISFRQRALERYMWLCLQHASPYDCSAVMSFLNSTTIPVSERAKALFESNNNVRTRSRSNSASSSKNININIHTNTKNSNEYGLNSEGKRAKRANLDEDEQFSL